MKRISFIILSDKLLPVLGDYDELELSAFLILYLRQAEEASQEIVSALHK